MAWFKRSCESDFSISLVAPTVSRKVPSVEKQIELVAAALIGLERVQAMVADLAEVPGADAAAVRRDLAQAAERLRQLYFLDAVY